MVLTFNPALVEETAVAVPSQGAVAVRFVATFSSRAAYEQARDEQVAVELWTDLPTDASADGWHALRFPYREEIVSAAAAGGDEATASKQTLVLAPPTAQSPDRDDRTVELSLVLRNVRPGSRYSFTYRLVYASGAVAWLGAYHRDGVLVFEDRDERLQWADQWRLDGCQAVKEPQASNAEVEKVASLNRDNIHWTRWAFGEFGWPTLSETYATPPCKAVFLLPRQTSSIASITVPQPLLITAPEDGASVSIDGMGTVFAKHAQIVSVYTVEPQDVANALRSVLPENAQVLDIVSQTGYVAVTTPSAQETLFPVALSLIPSQLHESTSAVMVNSKDILDMVPFVQSPEVVLVNPAVQAFSFIHGSNPVDITVQVGSSGGQLLLSPLHAIPATEESAWKLAVLSPTLSATIVDVPVQTESSPALPTPPPSPPPVLSGTRTPGMIPQPITVPSFQSFHSLAESESSDAPPKRSEPVEPLTPTSPEQATKRLGEENSEESDHENSTSSPESEPAYRPVVPRQTPMHESFLRFLFTWMVRALFARVWGLMDTSARWLGFQSLFRLIFVEGRKLEHNAYSQTKRIKADKPVAAEPKEEVKDIKSVTAHEEHEDASVAGDDATVTLIDHTDDETGVEVEEDTEIKTIIDIAPAVEPVSVIARKPESMTFAPSAIQPLLPRTKPRFLADVRSNIVSFLVHAPSFRSKLSDLAISINEKRVQDNDGEGYTYKQLAGDVYILGMPGHDGGSKVEVEIETGADHE